jgi:ubiquinol-cytochrome c reductase cytochrome c1 subunit
MPHVLWELQGQQILNKEHKLELSVPGKLSAEEYNKQVADLVGFLVWAGEPGAGFRKQLGFGVLGFLAVLFCVAYPMKKRFWKDVK